MGEVVQFPGVGWQQRTDLIGEAMLAYRRFCKREYGFLVDPPKAERSLCRQIGEQRWLIVLQDDSHGVADYEWDCGRLTRVA